MMGSPFKTDAAAAYTRAALCYFLVTQIPDEGLAELKVTMEEIRDFYRMVNPQSLPSLTSNSQISGTLNTPTVRENFVIEEE